VNALSGIGGGATLVAALLLSACHRESPPAPSSLPTPSPQHEGPTTAASTSGNRAADARGACADATTSAPGFVGAASAGSVSGSGAAVASAIASAPAPLASALPPDPENKRKPALASADLDIRASRLFEAIKANDPSLAKDFFFPREPFIPLKDAANAGGYWDTLYKVYANDIHQLHRERATSLAGATFVSFTLGTTPTWVKPGEEWNKIGYYRTFNGKLKYRTGEGAERSIEVKVIISWGDAWYVTHLLPIKH
jgi:hypothetical protein